MAVFYLGLFGSALTFYLWAFALSRTTPTRVAISVTVNPITAALVGAVLLDEPIRWNLIAGLVAVFLGIWIATTVSRRIRPADQPIATRPNQSAESRRLFSIRLESVETRSRG
jgi:threonine/homoserine efflux transporter RhtA